MTNSPHWQQLSPEKGVNNRLDQLFEHEGYPVLVHSVGQYPVAINTQGETTRNHPYFAIVHAGITTTSPEGSTTVYTRIQVEGYMGSRRGRRDSLTLWSMDLDNVSDLTPFLELAKQHLEVAQLLAITSLYDAAEKRIAEGNAYTAPLSREEYEAACLTLGVSCYPDAQCSPWGDFGFPSYSADRVLAEHLAYLRWRQLRDDAEAAQQSLVSNVVPDIPEANGQLWEPCERCGAEPIYMPLHLCENCWPTSH